MHGRPFFAAIGIAVLAVTASQAACPKSEAPSCAFERIPSETVFDECRNAMLKFRDAMESYASCLGETSADQKKAADDEYESVRIQFNRRARGEFDYCKRTKRSGDRVPTNDDCLLRNGGHGRSACAPRP